jgi:hypothetical protein
MEPINSFVDLTTTIYVVIALVCGYGFHLFTWWWWRIGRATDVYIYVTGVFFSVGITAWVGVYSRYLHYANPEYYHIFIKSWKWAVGPLMVGAVLTLICVRMTMRVVRTYLHRSGFLEERREEIKEKGGE